MIKRYSIQKDCCFPEMEFNDDGDFVKYEDIKNLMPDNRLESDDFLKLFSKNIWTAEEVYEFIRNQGWIK